MDGYNLQKSLRRSKLETNLDRIITDMEKMAEFTSTTEGVTRLSYSKEDKQAKEYLKKEMKKVNLKIWEDGFGNLFGRREGLNPDAPVVMIGSHYDTVFHGGPIDGVAGVVAALEVLRVLEDNNIENYYPIELIAMNAEEGYRFGISAGTGIANSRALVGKMTEEELDSAKDRDGISKREAMIDYGLVPDLNNVTRPKGSIKTFIELHNEQGRVLEETNTDIGIVDCFPGTGTYLLKFKGRLDNTAVPMDARKDPLLAASKFVIAVNKIAKKMDGKISGQVGRLNVDPNLAAYVSEEVNLNVQFRIFDEHTHNTIDLYEILEQEVKRIEKETDVEIEL